MVTQEQLAVDSIPQVDVMRMVLGGGQQHFREGEIAWIQVDDPSRALGEMLPILPFQIIGKGLDFGELLDGHQVHEAQNTLFQVLSHLSAEGSRKGEEEYFGTIFHLAVLPGEASLHLLHDLKVPGEQGDEELDGRMGVGGSQRTPPMKSDVL